MVCVECLSKRQAMKKKSEFEKTEADESVKMICLSCRFKFSVRKSSLQALRCPYCAKTKLMVVKKYKDEDDLIKDSMNPRFDY